jgi:hypothetical protein
MAAISTIKMTITQLIGCLRISKLMISILLGPLICPLLLNDAGSGSEDRKADGNHENYGYPICGGPTDD